MVRLLATALAALTLVIGATLDAEAQKKSSTFTLEVAAGRWKSAHFQGLPRRGSLTLDIKSDGQISILLFDSEGYDRFPEAEDPLFQGQTADTFGFSLKLPKSGDYYLVIDNRAGTAARRVKIFVEAAAPGSARRDETAPEAKRSAHQAPSSSRSMSGPRAIEDRCSHQRARLAWPTGLVYGSSSRSG